MIADDEAKATALGTEPVVNKGASGKLTKLAREVEEHTAAADRFGRAVVQLDDEVRRVTMDNASELLDEAVSLHDTARERVTQLVAELHAQQGELRAAYIAAQRIYSATGQSTLSAHLRVAPTIETLVRDGGTPPLINEDDRALTV